MDPAHSMSTQSTPRAGHETPRKQSGASSASSAAKDVEFLDDDESSEFVDYPISSPVVRSKYAGTGVTTPSRVTSLRSPTSSSVKRRSLLELKEKRNSRLFQGTTFNDTLNLADDNVDILDLDQNALPRASRSPANWKVHTSSSYAAEAEDLRKKVTGYQLQIRLIMDFLQQNGTHELLNGLESTTDLELASTCRSCDKRNTLEQDLDQCRETNRQLEHEVHVAGRDVDSLNSQLNSLCTVMANSEELIDDILQRLEVGADQKTKFKVSQAKEKDMDVKLAVISMILKNNSAAAADGADLAQVSEKLDASQKQFADLERELDQSAEDSKYLVESYNTLWKEFNKQQEVIENLKSRGDGSGAPDEALGALEAEKASVAQDLASARAKIAELETSIKDSQNDTDSELNGLRTKLDLLQDELKEKDVEIQRLNRSLDSQKTSMAIDLEEDRAKIEELSKELDAVLDRQRVQSSERSDLKRQLDSLRREKSIVEQDLEFVRQELNSARTVPSGSADLAKFWHRRYEELLVSDTRITSRFLKIFETVLDSISISQAKTRFYELSKLSAQGGDEKRAKELHESLFHYYVNAAQAIVKDYFAAIKAIEELEKDKNSQIIALTNQVNEYKSRGLQQSKDEGADDDSILRYRIEELSRKWKLERESRKLENDNAQQRFKEMEQENKALREKVKQVN